ncbi:P-loop containing nucleoside triphosphate hydrolase protein, partial [Mycena olivaceomarginata]
STLYRRRATGFGDWDINIAPRAERNLREYSRRDRRTFILIVKKMRELSNGDFSPENYIQLNGSNVEIPIYEAKVSEDLRLVYQVDCVPYMSRTELQAALKVFGIYEKAQLSRGSFWDSMGRELGKKGEEYKERCIQRQGAGGCIFVPVTFPTQEDARFNPGSVPDLPSDDAEQVCPTIDYVCAPLSDVHQPLLDSIVADLDVAFVLEVSPKELEIIEHPNSCYVLGRSGTGKTTSMLYKMLLIEASSKLSTPETRKIRQLFVTQSRILADKVGEHFAKLLGGYQPSAISENVKAARRADRALVDVEESDWRPDLPKKYSDLQDTDFPLFVSFDQLCTMIEHDMQNSGYRADTGKTTRLTYAKFHREYWPHFSHSACKGFEPSMVFSEFMGVIMGSEKALASKTCCLDREVYLNLGERGQSTFGDQRERIYDLFEKYSSQKRRQGHADPADRSHEIIKFFQDHGVPGKKVDYLYVDETQDNLLVDTLRNNMSTVLRSICQNPNGLFWAGDTAQTISVGSSFRFNELKAFLHRVEERRRKKHPELSFQPVASPRPFQLTVNYRSHAGIVNCAHSVIEVITKLWPDAIDTLDRERGTVDGLQPIFFTNWDSENVQSKQFLFGDQSFGYIELGAQQCILVRNDTAKENLRRQVGDIGLIMTLYESKGLEFNDVFIYNFFEDSGVAEAQWRVVLNVMDKRTNDGTPSAPIFDKMRHASVCTELKFLYVAITRARNNIWIADCSTKGEPMRMLWTSKNQVQNCVLGTDTPRFAISSTSAEWQEQGRKLFDSKRFSQAKLCYERAYMPHEAAVSHAYHLREEASGMPHNHRREIAARRTAFLQVAATFLGCARNERAKNAAEAYFRRAGKCFEDAGDFNQAIDAYNHAKDFSRVAELYLDMGKIDQAVATVKNHDRDIKPNVAQRVISVMGKIDQAVATVKNHDRDINPNVAQRVISVTGNIDQAVATVKNHDRDINPNVAQRVISVTGNIDQAVATVKNHDRDIKPNVAQRVISVMGKIDQAVATVKNHDRDINPNVAQRVISVTGNIDQAVATVKNHDRDINPNVAQRVIGVARLFYFKKGQFE